MFAERRRANFTDTYKIDRATIYNEEKKCHFSKFFKFTTNRHCTVYEVIGQKKVNRVNRIFFHYVTQNRLGSTRFAVKCNNIWSTDGQKSSVKFLSTLGNPSSWGLWWYLISPNEYRINKTCLCAFDSNRRERVRFSRQHICIMCVKFYIILVLCAETSTKV